MKINKRLGVSLLLLFSIIFVISISNSKGNKQENQSSALIGKSAPNFSLKTIDGKSLKLSSLKGKVVILDFWATWCGPCRMEIPSFIELQKKYQKKGLVIIGMALDDLDKVKKFAKENKINYHVVIGNDDISLQYGGISAIPTTFIIGKDHKIKKQHVGVVSQEDFEKEIKELL
jgi:DsbE subfamily thiol:disulfide oxidoreductase